eukprot:5756606-Amphidinium_carterae.1
MGYITYGANVSDNILHALPGNVWGDSARIAAGVSVACVYPIFAQAMVAPALNLPPQLRRSGYLIAIFLTVLVTALGALVLRSLGIINVLNGSFASIAFVGLCPAVVGLFLLDRSSRLWKLGMVFLLVIPTTGGILGIMFTDNYKVRTTTQEEKVNPPQSPCCCSEMRKFEKIRQAEVGTAFGLVAQ